MKKHLILALAAALGTIGLAGCDGDSDKNTDDTTDTGTDTGFPPSACTEERADIGTGEVGEPCWEIEDCKSGNCAIFQSIPDPGDGVCAEANPTNILTVQATVRNFETLELLANTVVDFGAALTFSTNPIGASPVATATSDANGKIEVDFDTKACTEDSLRLGVVGRIKKDGYYLSMGGIVAPEVDGAKGIYPSVLRNHDVLAVPADMLTAWSALLANDTEVASYLPLGDKGGCVVLTRKISDGSGVVGTKLQSNTNPTGSTALVRYLNEDKDGFNTTGMASHGIALVLKPGLGEKFDAVNPSGDIVSLRPGTMGSSAKGIYTNTLHIK